MATGIKKENAYEHRFDLLVLYMIYSYVKCLYDKYHR